MKTPRLKAVELVEKFKPCAADYEYDFIVELGNAKICALIAVDEIISVLPSINGRQPNYQDINKYVTEYWQEVKTEINNL